MGRLGTGHWWRIDISYVISLVLICSVLSGCISQRPAKPKEDITGEPFDGLYTPEVEKVCCGHCLRYGLYDSSADCLAILQENEGTKQCIFILTDHPHTHFQCTLALQEPTPAA